MSEKEAGTDGEQLPTVEGAILGNNRASALGKHGPTTSNMALPPPDEPEEEELDEFGLPVPKIVVSSRPPSSGSDSSFESARSSIDEDIDPARVSSKSHDEDEGADVEDNDVEDAVNEETSPIEWPRLSRSTLPGSGHVKSSPFHTSPRKPSEKNTKYAERAKDLIKVSPVSNSIFKRQESPIESPISPSASTNTITSEVDSKTTPQENPPAPTESPQETPTPTAPIKEPEEPKDVPASEEKPKPKISTDISHSRHSSKNSTQTPKSATVIFEDPDDTALNPSGASEWSHQMGVVQEKPHTSPNAIRKSVDNDGWQTMEAYAAYDLYDDDGRLVAKQFEDSESEDEAKKAGAGKGYTRMNQDEDAQSADSMDENTQYLFHESLDDSDATTPLSQMQATKELLTEGQRIAYVGLCKLTIVGMLRDVGRVRYKENRAAYESMTLWSQKMMIRLFGHMDISSAGCPCRLNILMAEQVMIEQLAEHGVIPDDLIPALMANAEVNNPLAETSSISDGASLASRQSKISESSRSSSPRPSTSSTSPPPIQSPSTLTASKIAIDLRWTVLCDLFLVLIADSFYDSRSRVLLERMGNHLNVEWLDITRFERRVTEALQIQESSEQTWHDDALIDQRAKQARNRRYMLMGLATIGGGLVIGLSAGLLAPVIGAGLGAAFTTVGITGTTGFLAGTGGAALITTTGVSTGSIIAVKGMAKRTKSVTTFEFRPLHNSQRVNLLLTVPGWMATKEDDVRLPFSTLDPVVGDVITLLWEPEILTSIGQTVNLLATEILTQSLQQLLGQTVLMALMSSIQWPNMLTKLSYLIDNPWSTSLDRAHACGLLLADTLMHRHLGQRPISLVGYSLGARVIYYCLLELAKHRAYGLVQDVYLYGAPIIIKQKECLRAQSVVAGRFLNGYKRNDWILGYLFRASTTGLGRVAGLRPIENCGDIENMDCTEFVPGHLMYRDAMPKLMKDAGFVVFSEEFNEMEDPDPDKHRERQIALYDEIEEAKKLVAEEEAEALKAGKKVKRRTRKSGFLGLWGKEIETKPANYDEAKKSPTVGQSGQMGEYNPDEENENMGTNSTATKSKDDDMVLFDVDKMREELAANGVTMTTLESTLPPLVVSPPQVVTSPSQFVVSPPGLLSKPPAAPSMHRSSTTPAPIPLQRAHSPSLPVMSHHNLSTSNVPKPPIEQFELRPRNITPHRELDKLVVDTKKMPIASHLAPPANEWDTSTAGGGITMSFEPESPRVPTVSALRTTNETYMHPSLSVSSHVLGEKADVRPASILSMPMEKNVWDDEDDLGSGGNITMSFE